jgi:hypothetical protein
MKLKKKFGKVFKNKKFNKKKKGITMKKKIIIDKIIINS